MRATLTLLLAGLVGLLAPSLVLAQSFQEAITRALSNNCEGLNGQPPSGTYQPNLSDVCNDIPGGAGSTSSGSIASQGSTGTGAEARRILLRLEEKRQEANLGVGVRAASADQSQQRGRLGVFLTTEFEWVNKSTSPNEPAFESSSKGFIAGADYAFFPWLTAGGAVHYSYLDGNFDSQGGSFNTQAFGFTLYGSASPMPNLFIDGTIGYIHREYEISRRANFFMSNGAVAAGADGFADGNTTGDEFNLGVLGGYDFHLGALTVGPRAGVSYLTNSINGYAENPRPTQSPTGLELVYDDQHRESLTTKLGFFASYAFGVGFGVLVPQVNAEWVHEFLDNQRVVYFRFREDNLQARLRFQTDKPDRDYFHVGAGLVLVLPKDISAFVSYRALLGYNDRIAHTLDAGIRIAF
jgi:outer membrane autotransporter protein